MTTATQLLLFQVRLGHVAHKGLQGHLDQQGPLEPVERGGTGAPLALMELWVVRA